VTLLTAPPAGSAHLTFTRSGAGTVLTRAFATSPAKLIETKRRGPACWVYAATLGGGLVGGDDIRLTADVTDGARALLTTQASTKVYRSLRPSQQSLIATIGADALLAVVPDPIVCFADANFTQTQRYDLHGDASLVMVDWMTSGRHAAGERWAFARYENRFDITRAGRRIFFDRLVLESNLDSVATRMGRFDVLLTAVITGPLVATAAADIVTRTSQAPTDRVTRGGMPATASDFVASAASLRDGGALLRIAGTSVEHVAHILRTYLTFLPPLIGDDLWSRKW
jgi:urease accessory protein